MSDSRRYGYLQLSLDHQEALIAAARDTEPVRGLTHGFYKYPARFSPVFARAAIETFTKPGDVVLDPHVGGGTTLVEARAAGREAVGVDISTLAEFVSNVKCMVYSAHELDKLATWSRRVASRIDILRPSSSLEEYAELGYYKHLDHPSRWRLRKSIEQGITCAISLGTPRLEAFGRCVVLRTAQWALDGRSKLPSVDEFRRFLEQTAKGMVEGARELRAAVQQNGRESVTVLNRSAAGIEEEFRLREMRSPRLVVTSPPYGKRRKHGRRSENIVAKIWPPPKIGGYCSIGHRHNNPLPKLLLVFGGPLLAASTPLGVVVWGRDARSAPKASGSIPQGRRGSNNCRKQPERQVNWPRYLDGRPARLRQIDAGGAAALDPAAAVSGRIARSLDDRLCRRRDRRRRAHQQAAVSFAASFRLDAGSGRRRLAGAARRNFAGA